jgi:radical SAM superfamily enzyme
VHGVKLHNLHVLRGTPLEQAYRQGNFVPISLEAYAGRVASFLEHLSPEVCVHRLSAVASRWEEVVAPDWVRHKLGPAQVILDTLERMDTWQGRLYLEAAQPQAVLWNPLPAMVPMAPGSPAAQ